MALKFLNDGYFAGKVGIGTASPVRKLHIEDTTGNPQLVIGDGASIYSSIQSANSLYINAGDGGGGSSIIFRRGTALVESMRIDSSGNVGIGTASPGAKLEISKSQDTTFIITSSYNGGWATQNYGHIEFKSEDLSGTTDPRAAITGLQFSNGAYGGLGLFLPTD